MELPNSLVFYVNGRKIVETNPDPRVTLLHYLRYKLRLTGCKEACGEGGCGACTVMISEYDKTAGYVRHYSANCCLIPVCYLQGLAVTTVEGIGSMKTLHPVQERLAKAHGSQCGFCTPGMIMSMYALLRNHPHPSEDNIRNHLDGNLCRCTGYRPILDGFKTFTQGTCELGEACCRNRTGEEEMQAHDYACKSYDGTQEPIFPPELKTNWSQYHETSHVFRHEDLTWYHPVSLSELLQLKSDFPHAKIIVGNTKIGIETRFRGECFPVQIQATDIPELKQIVHSATEIMFGAAVTLTLLKDTLRKAVHDLQEEETRIFRGFLNMLRWFGSTQIRNISSIGGHIMSGSPLSDLSPLLLASGSTLEIGRHGVGTRRVNMDACFGKDGGTTCLEENDVLLSVTIPRSNKNEFFQSYKQSARKEMDSAIVNAGMKVVFQAESDTVKEICLVYGGMASHVKMAVTTMASIVGRRWQNEMLSDAISMLAKEFRLEPEVKGGMCQYRQTLAVSLFFKFYLSVQAFLAKQTGTNKYKIPSAYQSAVSDIEYPLPTSSHVYDDVTSVVGEDDVVGRPMPHDSIVQHTTGQAKFLDDVPAREDELFMSLVLSERAHAELVNVDASDALALEGVVDFITGEDIPGVKTWGVAQTDEEVFASKKVLFRGQTIGAIVAESRDIARRAAAKVKVIYKDLQHILTIKEAIAAESYYGDVQVMTSGDTEVAFERCENVEEGETRTDAQEHFYMETMGSLVIPGAEDGKIEVYTGTQISKYAQGAVCKVLGVPANKVVVKVKRIGGAFGGKQSRNLLTTLPAAVAAHKLGRPVRCVLDRNVDMLITGTRHPLWAKYKVGFDQNGQIQAYTADVYVNGGMSLDYSRSVLGKQILHCDASYKIPNITFRGYACRTNIASNTSFRGFGLPQITMVTEQAIKLVADTLGRNPEEIRRLNLYQEGELTHFNQVLSPCSLATCWKECMSVSNFDQRRKEVDIFNSENRWKKRGLSMLPMKQGMSFPAFFNQLNQASALVHIYLDGSVLVSHAGIEMGQGINVKMIQIASRELKIPMSLIHVEESSTDKINHSSPTAASITTDIAGGAVLDACKTLYGRIQPYIGQQPKGTWEDWLKAAYLDRVQLMATGFYRTPGLHCGSTSDSSVVFSYFLYGVGCSEVEVDCLTGEHQILRTDLVIDAGRSLNPAVDFGQVEGAFSQGCGLFMLEQYRMSPDGLLLSQGPGSYKIPTIGNIPRHMNIHFLKDSRNDNAVYGSKGVGEPPMILSMSVYFAIWDAITSARADAGATDRFLLDCPATTATIRMACLDQFTEKFPSPPEGSYMPWEVRLS